MVILPAKGKMPVFIPSKNHQELVKKIKKKFCYSSEINDPAEI